MEIIDHLSYKIFEDKFTRGERLRIYREKVRSLIAQKLNLEESNISIIHNEDGKAFLNSFDNNINISISHCQSAVAIRISNRNIVAIDIEYLSNKILKIRDKFLSSEEALLLDINSIVDLTLLWTAKETAYKYYSIRGANINDYKLTHIDKEKSILRINNKLQINYKILDKHILSWI